MKDTILKFDIPFCDLDGKPVPGEATLGKSLASFIARLPREQQILKVYSWAKKLNSGEPLHLDPDDKGLLKDIITGLKQASCAFQAQCLEVIETAPEGKG